MTLIQLTPLDPFLFSIIFLQMYSIPFIFFNVPIKNCLL